MTPSGAKKCVDRPRTLSSLSAFCSRRVELRGGASVASSRVPGATSMRVARSRAGTSSCASAKLLLPLELRIERVAKAVTEEGEADQRDRDADGGERDQVRVGPKDLLTVGDKAAPRRAR